MGILEPSAKRVVPAVVVLCLIAYIPFLSLPLISDDYLQIGLARQYGSWQGQATLFADALYRCRATSLWITWVIDRLFGPHALPLAAFCLALHIANCLLIFAFGAWNRVGWQVSALAACFFAVYEGHQEAVVWISAMPELLVFFFGTASLLTAIRFLRGDGNLWLAITCLAFPLALLSKESAVVVPALIVVVAFAEGISWRRWLPLTAAMGVLVLLYTYEIFIAKQNHLHFNDGTFNLSAPFLVTLLISISRLFWFWGLLALVAGFALQTRSASPNRPLLRLFPFAAAWIVITFLPYVFLTYMPRVPSRHTYWASAGLALIVAASFLQAFLQLADRRRVLAVVAAAIVIHNCGYLWFKKLGQYQERARSTQELIQFSQNKPGPIRVRCFPYGPDIVFYSLEISHGRPRSQVEINPAAAGDSFCFVPRSR